MIPSAFSAFPIAKLLVVFQGRLLPGSCEPYVTQRSLLAPVVKTAVKDVICFLLSIDLSTAFSSRLKLVLRTYC